MTNRKLLVSTFLASVVLHVLVGALTWRVPLLGTSQPAAKAAEAVELFLVDDAATATNQDPELPTQYLEMPQRLEAERPPDRADYLGLYDSRAADRSPGGDDDAAARADEAAPAPQVAITREDLARQPGVLVPQEQPRDPARQESERERPRRQSEAGSLGQWDLPRPSESDGDHDWLRDQQAPSILESGDAAAGDRGFDFDQIAQGDMSASTSVEGDYSLNTYEWNYAPWMHRFVQDLHRNWIAPYAYRLGVIHGVTRIRLVVEKDGRPSAMEIVEVEGHESLHKASTAALQAFAPYAPLPADFPEPDLVILLSLHYPQWKR